MTAGKVQRLLTELGDKNAYLRQRAARELGRVSAIPTSLQGEVQRRLAQASQDGNRYVACEAATSLVSLGLDSAGGLATLEALLNEPHRGVRTAAAVALGELGASAQNCLTRLDDLSQSDPDPSVRLAATDAAASIRGS